MSEPKADSTQFKENNRWIIDNQHLLKKSYSTQWIAVLNQTVIDKDVDLRKLVNRLKENQSSVYSQIAVEYIPEEEPEMVPPIFSKT